MLPKLSRRVIMVGWVTAALVALGALYVYFVYSRNKAYLAARNFRVLGVIERQLRETVQTVPTMMAADLRQSTCGAAGR
jgi:hypothetical protein